MFFAIVPFMFLPKNMESILHLPSEFVSYFIGITIYGMIYWMQQIKIKSQGALA